MEKYLSLIIVFAAVFVCHAESVSLTVLQSTDIHAAGGVANIAAWINEVRQADPELLLVDCGDLTRGAFEAFADGGASMVSVLNACQYDVWVPGNHEFRIGGKNFRRNMDLFTSGDVLAANLKFVDPASAPKRAILPWKMFERKGLKIAVIGLTVSYTDEWFGFAPYAGITLRPIAEALTTAIEEIREAKADLVFIAAHMGKPLVDALKPYPEISLLMAGHTHQVVPATEVHTGTWMVQPPIHGKGLAKITVTYNKTEKRVETIASEFLMSDAIEPAADMPADWIANNQKAAEMKEAVIVRLPEDMKLGPGKKGVPSELAQLIARSVVEATGADASINQTYSGWRNKGRELTALDFTTMIPNEYYITILTLTPEELQAIIKEIGSVAWCSYGIDENNVPDKPISVAFDAYTVHGNDGVYRTLRTIANSGTVARRDLDLTIRDTTRDMLMRLYPAK